ncbi:MAG: galactokinase family protein [Christensenellales bacterium]
MRLSGDSIKDITGGAWDCEFAYLYQRDTEKQKSRYINALYSFEQIFGTDREVCLISAPGRTELGGNHTDHQFGRVLAAAVTMDILAVAAKRSDGIIHVHSQGFKPETVDIKNTEKKHEEINTSAALIRGVAAGFLENGYLAGGFDAYAVSDIPAGSGLSSSAAFEVLIGAILNKLYNGGSVGSLKIAQIGQYAENVYFGKPCGLMDQTASSVGGIVSIDFKSPSMPAVQKIDYNFSRAKHTLIITDAGGSHADLSDEYASIPAEMKSVAAYFSKQALREVDGSLLYENISALRSRVTDRAVLRAIHFFDENDRVEKQIESLKNSDMETFKKLMISSGFSSMANLQNCYPSGNTAERSVSLALSLSERILNGMGAWRIHGGGFAGTILSLVPDEIVNEYISGMESAFKKGCCHKLIVRPEGAYVMEGDNG